MAILTLEYYLYLRNILIHSIFIFGCKALIQIMIVKLKIIKCIQIQKSKEGKSKSYETRVHVYNL